MKTKDFDSFQFQEDILPTWLEGKNKMENIIICTCEFCGKEVELVNFANLPDEEACIGIICQECARAIDRKEEDE